RGEKKEGATRAPTPVRVKVVQKRAASLATRYSATILPATQVDLAFRVSGYVQSIFQVKDGNGTRNVQEGDLVKKRTVLAIGRQWDREQRAAAASATVQEALAAEKQAQFDYDRVKTLFDKQTVSKAELDGATLKLETAKARVAAARAQAGEATLAVDDTQL